MVRFRVVLLGALASVVMGAIALSGACADGPSANVPPPDAPSIGEDSSSGQQEIPSASIGGVSGSTSSVNQAFSAVQRIMDGEQLTDVTPDQAIVSQTDGQSTSRLLGQMMVSLGLVIALVLGIAWAAKKFVLKQYTLGGGRIEVITSLAISPKSKLHLVRVGDDQFLIGESPQSINLISSVDAEYHSQLARANEPALERQAKPGQDVTPFNQHMVNWTQALENRAAPDVKSSLAMLQGLSRKLRGGGNG